MMKRALTRCSAPNRANGAAKKTGPRTIKTSRPRLTARFFRLTNKPMIRTTSPASHSQKIDFESTTSECIRAGGAGDSKCPHPSKFSSTQRCRMNVPPCRSAIACLSCSCVFITIGPYQATGSSIGLPDTSRKRMPSVPACTVISSPRSNSTSE